MASVSEEFVGSSSSLAFSSFAVSTPLLLPLSILNNSSNITQHSPRPRTSAHVCSNTRNQTSEEQVHHPLGLTKEVYPSQSTLAISLSSSGIFIFISLVGYNEAVLGVRTSKGPSLSEVDWEAEGSTHP